MIPISIICGILFIGFLCVFIELRQHKKKQYIQDMYPRRKELAEQAVALGLNWNPCHTIDEIRVRDTSLFSDYYISRESAEAELMTTKAARYYSLKEELVELNRKFMAQAKQLEDTLHLLYRKSDELAMKEAALTKWTEAASKLQKRIDELAAEDRAVKAGLDCYDYHRELLDQYSIPSSNQLGKKSGRKKRKPAK